MFQLKIHLIFCLSRPLAWELRLDHRTVLPSSPHLGLFKATATFDCFLLSHS